MHMNTTDGFVSQAERPAKETLKTSTAPLLDPTDYAEDMEAFDMTDEQKQEFLEILWSIMRSFAEMGFTVDLCGQLFSGFNEAARLDSDGVESEDSTKSEKPAGKESSP